MKRLTVLVLVAACGAPHTPVAAARHGEETPAATTGPTPTVTRSPLPRVRPSEASRSRSEVDPAPRPARTHLNWRALRECESSNNYNDRDSATYRGAYQFDRQTWQSVGGTGDPADATPAEQDMRAQRLYDERGRAPWPVCGRRL